MSRQLMQDNAHRSREGASNASSASSQLKASTSSSNGQSCESRKRKVAGSSEPMEMQLPLLADEEPALHLLHSFQPLSSSFLCKAEVVPQHSSSSSSSSSPFICVSKSLFSLADESRDRGSAKIASITVSLQHPSFLSPSAASSGSRASAPTNTRSYTSCFKIDGRKSFSNAPFKRYYHRGIHAAWFADLQPSSSSSSSSASNSCALSNGRVLMLLSQRAGRPNGKGFTGLKHDPAEISPKHPLLCLASNSVEYYVSVFVNRSNTPVSDEESAQVAAVDWNEVEVEISARFDAGQVQLQPVSLPHKSLARPVSERQLVQVRRSPKPQLPSSVSISSMTSMESLSSMRSAAAAQRGSASPSSSSETASPVSVSDHAATSSDDTASPMEDSEEGGESECEMDPQSGAATPVHESNEHMDYMQQVAEQGLQMATPMAENISADVSWTYPAVSDDSQRPMLKSPEVMPLTRAEQAEQLMMLPFMPMPLLRLTDIKEEPQSDDVAVQTPASKRAKLTIEHHAHHSAEPEQLFQLPDWNSSSPQAPLMHVPASSPINHDFPYSY